jgi:hypothetical protein
MPMVELTDAELDLVAGGQAPIPTEVLGFGFGTAVNTTDYLGSKGVNAFHTTAGVGSPTPSGVLPGLGVVTTATTTPGRR